MLILCQITWSLSKQELLFSDFCEDSDNIEEGAEYNKVLCKQHHEALTPLLICYMDTNCFLTHPVYYKAIQVFALCIIWTLSLCLNLNICGLLFTFSKSFLCLLLCSSSWNTQLRHTPSSCRVMTHLRTKMKHSSTN